MTLVLSNFHAAAWDFYNKHKAEIGWDLVVIHPPLVSSFSYIIFRFVDSKRPVFPSGSWGRLLHVNDAKMTYNIYNDSQTAFS